MKSTILVNLQRPKWKRCNSLTTINHKINLEFFKQDVEVGCKFCATLDTHISCTLILHMTVTNHQLKWNATNLNLSPWKCAHFCRACLDAATKIKDVHLTELAL